MSSARLAGSLSLSPIAPGSELVPAGAAPPTWIARILVPTLEEWAPGRAGRLAGYRVRSASHGRSARVAVLRLRSRHGSSAGLLWLMSRRTAGEAEELRLRFRLSRCSPELHGCRFSMSPGRPVMRLYTERSGSVPGSADVVAADVLCHGLVLSLGAYASPPGDRRSSRPSLPPISPAELGRVASQVAAVAAGHGGSTGSC